MVQEDTVYANFAAVRTGRELGIATSFGLATPPTRGEQREQCVQICHFHLVLHTL